MSKNTDSVCCDTIRCYISPSTRLYDWKYVIPSLQISYISCIWVWTFLHAYIIIGMLCRGFCLTFFCSAHETHTTAEIVQIVAYVYSLQWVTYVYEIMYKFIIENRASEPFQIMKWCSYDRMKRKKLFVCECICVCIWSRLLNTCTINVYAYVLRCPNVDAVCCADRSAAVAFVDDGICARMLRPALWFSSD